VNVIFGVVEYSNHVTNLSNTCRPNICNFENDPPVSSDIRVTQKLLQIHTLRRFLVQEVGIKDLTNLIGFDSMGFKMDNIHLPTTESGGASSNGDGADTSRTFQELVTRKENLEAELSALGSVLDSVRRLMFQINFGRY
jgi:hypothetical protein